MLINFLELKIQSPIFNRIGFMETKNKTKHYRLKSKLSELTEPYDFYSNETYFFVKTNGATPYEELGELKLSTRIKIIYKNNGFNYFFKYENRRFTYSRRKLWYGWKWISKWGFK